MKLDKQQKDKLIKVLQKFEFSAVCSICQTNDWNVADTIFEMREFQGGNLVISTGQSVYPAIPIICKNCGNTLLINPISIGILSPTKQEE